MRGLSSLVLALFVVTTSSIAEAESKVAWFGFLQSTMEGGKGLGNATGRPVFGLDRVRLGFKGSHKKLFGKVQLDAKKVDSTPVLTVPEFIKDAEVGYSATDSFNVKMGIFKTPVGMDLNTSGTKLDITKRGMEKALTLERATGVMVSGRKLGNFGFDVGYFNPPNRSGAVTGGTTSLQKAYAARIHFDAGNLHLEGSYGMASEAGGPEDYTVIDVAARVETGSLTGKAEFITGKNVLGVSGQKQWVAFGHLGYSLTDRLEPVARVYYGKSTPAVGGATSLVNAFVGFNYFFNPAKKNSERLQLNVVLPGGSRDTWTGLSGYTDVAYLTQLQFSI